MNVYLKLKTRLRVRVTTLGCTFTLLGDEARKRLKSNTSLNLDY